MRKSPCAKESFVDGAALGLGAGLLKGMRSGKSFGFVACCRVDGLALSAICSNSTFVRGEDFRDWAFCCKLGVWCLCSDNYWDMVSQPN